MEKRTRFAKDVMGRRGSGLIRESLDTRELSRGRMSVGQMSLASFLPEHWGLEGTLRSPVGMFWVH